MSTTAGHYGLDRERTDWLTVILLFVAGIGAAMHFAKVPAALPLISAELGFSPVVGGLAVSLVAVLGMLLGVASGTLVDAWGRRKLLLFALVVGALTSALIPLLPTSGAFLGLRLVEGISHLVIVVAAPSLMGVLAKPSDRTVVMTLWGSFFAVGFAVTDAVAPALLDGGGWSTLFWAHAGLLLLTAVLVAPRLSRLARQQTLEPPPTTTDVRALLRTLVTDHKVLYRNLPIVLAASGFGLHCLLFNAYLTYVREVLLDRGALDGGGVGPWMALLALLSIGSTIIIGGILLRLGVSPFTTLVVCFAGEALAGAALFTGVLGTASLLPASIVLFLFDGCVQGATFATIPLVATDRMAALAHGAFAQTGNIGSFLGPPVFAAAAVAGGWTAGAVPTVLGCVAGIACTILAARMARRDTAPATNTLR
ncbi:MFS transporter [Amycolatopsis cihanbeyliensis]|uniref:Putative MFS family arabinose efflux permease n=1 Tax=Amycolatopsis cihanbeyliensis TaxID=1128664 RepID=A0A542DIX9_AMYCI|nr:MFS transporter [Amycolatopsis cihanbeyliensis]TQJ03020.1 putative MFS family arabinose efflux permease [Amycolatopsis cihanbeyliensis]